MKTPYQEIDPNTLKQAMASNQTQGADTEPPKLDPQLVEMWKAVENELGRMRQRIFELEAALEPFSVMILGALDHELSKRGLERSKRNQFIAKSCEASAFEQFKYRYGI